jgi:uncharacterized protein
MPVIDTHTHVFPTELIEKRAEIVTRETGFGILYRNPRSKMVDADGLLTYMDEEGVDKAVITGFPFTDGGLIRLSNDYVLETAQRNERLIPFITIKGDDEGAAQAEVERCFALGARGVGELAYYETGFTKKERLALDGVASFLEDRDAPLMLHVNEQVGHTYPGKSTVDFESVVQFTADHPRLSLILAHMGGGICFYEFMPEIRGTFARVYYDMAATPFLYSKDLFVFAERFLPSKVLFGSDYPLLSLNRYRSDLKSLTAETQHLFLYDNGRRLLGV